MQEKSRMIIRETIISENNVTCNYVSKQEKIEVCINGEHYF